MSKIAVGTGLCEANLMHDRIQHLQPKSFKHKCGALRLERSLGDLISLAVIDLSQDR